MKNDTPPKYNILTIYIVLGLTMSGMIAVGWFLGVEGKVLLSVAAVMCAGLFLFDLMVRFSAVMQKADYLNLQIGKVRKDAESKYEQIASLIADGVYSIDETGTIVYVNKAVCEILGYEPSEMLGRNAHTLFHYKRPDGCNFPNSECPIANAYAAGQKYVSDKEWVVKKDGTICPVEFKTTPILKNGKPNGAVAIFQDITVRLHYEELIKQQNEVLEKMVLEKTQKLTKVVELFNQAQSIAHIGSWERNIDEEIITGSDEEYRIYGIPMGMQIEYAQLKQKMLDVGDDILEKIKAHYETSRQPYEFTHRIIRESDGSVRTLHTYVSLAFDKNAQPLKVYGLDMDITEQVHMTLRQKQQEQMMIQQSKMAAMGEMIGSIAHQWRQPLNALGIIIQDIKQAHKFGVMDDEYIVDAVKESMGQINFMSKTIDDFRNFFKPDKEPEQFKIIQALQDSVAILTPDLKASGIAIEVECDCADVYMIGYPNEFRQVVLNIIANAKDAILDKKIEGGQIKIHVFYKNDHVTVDIEDNAGGIDPDLADRIFEPYFTTKEQGRGTGVGLYMSKVIIEEHMSGRLFVKNTDKGAQFSIELPI